MSQITAFLYDTPRRVLRSRTLLYHLPRGTRAMPVPLAVLNTYERWKAAQPPNDDKPFRDLVSACIDNRQRLYELFPPGRIADVVGEAAGNKALGQLAGFCWRIFETTNPDSDNGVNLAVSWFKHVLPDVNRRRSVLITSFEKLRQGMSFGA